MIVFSISFVPPCTPWPRFWSCPFIQIMLHLQVYMWLGTMLFNVSFSYLQTNLQTKLPGCCKSNITSPKWIHHHLQSCMPLAVPISMKDLHPPTYPVIGKPQRSLSPLFNFSLLNHMVISKPMLSLSHLPLRFFPSSVLTVTALVVQFSRSVVSNSLWPHGLQHAGPPCPSPTPRVYSNSCPLSWWWPSNHLILCFGWDPCNSPLYKQFYQSLTVKNRHRIVPIPIFLRYQ